jgi:hypothetical protein
MFTQMLKGRIVRCARRTRNDGLRLVIAFGIFAATNVAKAETAPPELQSAVANWMQRTHPEAIHINTAHIFWKQGADKAAVFVDYEIADGGNSVSRLGQAFRHDALGWVPNAVPLEVFGEIIDGHLESADIAIVETQVLKSGDPRCCPTGHKSWRVSLNSGTPVSPKASQSRIAETKDDAHQASSTAAKEQTILLELGDKAKILIALNAVKHCQNLEVNQPALDLVKRAYDFLDSALKNAPNDYLTSRMTASEGSVLIQQISALRQLVATNLSIEEFAVRINAQPKNICIRIASPASNNSWSDLFLVDLARNGFFRNGTEGKYPASTAVVQKFRVPTTHEWSADFLGLIDTGVLFPHMACYTHVEGDAISQRRTFLCDGERQLLLSVRTSEVTPKARADELTSSCTESNHMSNPRCRMSVRIAPVFHSVRGLATHMYFAETMQLGDPENDPTGAF